jgi:hypothetical protein
METRRDLNTAACLAFAHYLIQHGFQTLDWDASRSKITGMNDGQKWSLRLPLHYPLAKPGQGFESYLGDLPDLAPRYFLILIQAGHSALAYFEGEEMLHHKVIKKYMVRGNGKAQIGYLQTRGKSKAGSRVRLANSLSFFEDINDKLTEWDCEAEAGRILYSCGLTLLPHWFQSKVPPPFEKEDERLCKIPYDCDRPDLEELSRLNKQIKKGRYEGPAKLVDEFFAEWNAARQTDASNYE